MRDEIRRTVLATYLTGDRWRWLTFRRDAVSRTLGIPAAPQSFSATVYDYEESRTLDLEGRLESPDATEVVVSRRQPLPTSREFDEAVSLLAEDPRWAPGLQSGEFLPYRPMPPFLSHDDGHRVVAVGLYVSAPAPGIPVHRRVGADLDAQQATDEQTDNASFTDCPAPPPADDCDDTGHTGQAEVVVSRHGTELWRFIVVRPAESSGTNGSGAELRHIHYRGRSVLARAHVPILNVEYGLVRTHSCGPAYRDWLNEESCFVARGTDVTSGIRLCGPAPQTMLDTGSDVGNFHGAAIHIDRDEVVVTSQLRAGWYRYITEWRLHVNGDITPRFGFSAVLNPCTCEHHIHHAYWRFDFAVDALDDHRVEEHNTLPLGASDPWRTLLVEERRDRDDQRKRHWKLTNRSTGAGYLLEPGWQDATTDLYGAGDSWFLRHHPDQIDDGQGFTSEYVNAQARIDRFADGEPIDGHDLAAWYAGHWDHAPGHPGDWTGPTLHRIHDSG